MNLIFYNEIQIRKLTKITELIFQVKKKTENTFAVSISQMFHRNIISGSLNNKKHLLLQKMFYLSRDSQENT